MAHSARQFCRFFRIHYYLLLFIRTTFSKEREEHIVCQTRKPAVWTRNVVQMKGITKVYPNGVAANQGVDFFLRRGEIHALMGENGAGKSTLMKMLFGLEQPTSGEIWVNGEKL